VASSKYPVPKKRRSAAIADVQKRRAYEGLAEKAAARCGLNPATAEAASENEEARDLRDGYWAELQRRVADVQTYTVDDLHEWIAVEMGVEIGRTSMQRLRAKHVGRLRAVRMRAELARQVIDAAGDRCETDVLEATRMLAGQAMFNATAGLDENSLNNLTSSQILKMFDSLSNMSRQDMETRYRKVQLGELMKQFDREANAKVKDSNGKLTPEDLAEIRKAVFGDV